MAKVSNKGQVTIPADIRQRLGLQPGDKIRFTPAGAGKAVLAPVRKNGSNK